MSQLVTFVFQGLAERSSASQKDIGKAVWLDSGGGAVRHAQGIELRLGCTNEFM